VARSPETHISFEFIQVGLNMNADDLLTGSNCGPNLGLAQDDEAKMPTDVPARTSWG
jgi:hypothetical protein